MISDIYWGHLAREILTIERGSHLAGGVFLNSAWKRAFIKLSKERRASSSDQDKD